MFTVPERGQISSIANLYEALYDKQEDDFVSMTVTHLVLLIQKCFKRKIKVKHLKGRCPKNILKGINFHVL